MSTWLDWGIARQLVKHHFWVCLGGCFQRRLACELVDPVRKIIIPQMWVGTIQSAGARIEQNGRGKANNPLTPGARTSSLSCRGHQNSSLPDLWTVRLASVPTIPHPNNPVLRPIVTTLAPWSWGFQTWTLPNLWDCKLQRTYHRTSEPREPIPLVKLFHPSISLFIHPSTHSIGSVSLESPD